MLPVAHGIERGYIGYEQESPEIEYIYVADGRIIRRILVHNHDDVGPSKIVVDRESAWDGVTNNETVAPQPPDDWLTISDIYDQRIDEMIKQGHSLRIRGVYFPGKIWSPPPRTPGGHFRLVTKNVQELPITGSNVEITAEVKSDAGLPYFVVSKIKALPANEPIRRLPAQRN